MFTEQSLMKLGFSERRSKELYRFLKNVEIDSNIGIRLSEDTLFQKIEFYQKEIGFSAVDVLLEPQLLTYNTTDSNSLNSAIAIIKFLKEELGLTNKDFKSGGYKLLSQSIDTLKEKISFLNSYLGYKPEHIRQAIEIMVYNPEFIIHKVEFFKETLGFTNKQFQNFTAFINLDTELVKEKFKFFQEELGFTASHIKKFPKLLTLDCSSDESVPTSVRYKIKFYKETLGYTNRQFQKYPQLLNLDCASDENVPTSARAKIKFFRETFGLENIDFQRAPEVFGFDCVSDENVPSSARGKFKFYKRHLGMTERDIKKNLILLHLDTASGLENPKSVMSKIKVLREIGMTNQDIRNQSHLLLTPAADIKTKYVLLSSIFPDKSFMRLKSWFITRPEKVYARYMYLTSTHFNESVYTIYGRRDKYELKAHHLTIGEGDFQKRYKIDSDTLMKMYPLDEKTIEGFYENYNSLGIQPPLQMS